MVMCKVTLVYQLADQGWTETWYHEAANVKTAATLTALQISRLIDFRSAATIIQAVRAVEVGGLHLGYPNPINRKSTLSSLAKPDVTAVSCTCRAATTDGGSRPLFLRGLADDDVIRSLAGVNEPSARLIAAIADYKAVVLARNWRMQKLEGIDVHPWQSITWMRPAPLSNNQKMLVTFNDSSDPIAVGQYIYFKGLDPTVFPGLKGYFKAVAVDSTGVTINFPWRLNVTEYTPINAFARRAEWTYPTVEDLLYQKLGTRDTGRPISQSRGRQRGISLRR